MRPLSIWAMQWALERHCGFNTPNDSTAHSLVSIEAVSSAEETEEEEIVEVGRLECPSVDSVSLPVEYLPA